MKEEMRLKKEEELKKAEEKQRAKLEKVICTMIFNITLLLFT